MQKNTKIQLNNLQKNQQVLSLNQKTFLPLKKYKNNYCLIMEILKPYHNPKKDILITIADIISTLEQNRDLIQNIAFDTTRVSQSASCIRTSLDEINFTFEKLQQFYQLNW